MKIVVYKMINEEKQEQSKDQDLINKIFILHR